jgi:hypothetical protein
MQDGRLHCQHHGVQRRRGCAGNTVLCGSIRGSRIARSMGRTDGQLISRRVDSPAAAPFAVCISCGGGTSDGLKRLGPVCADGQRCTLEQYAIANETCACEHPGSQPSRATKPKEQPGALSHWVHFASEPPFEQSTSVFRLTQSLQERTPRSRLAGALSVVMNSRRLLSGSRK